MPSAILRWPSDLSESDLHRSSLLHLPLDPREREGCIHRFPPLDGLEVFSVPFEMGNELPRGDSQGLRRIPSHLVGAALQEGDRANEVPVLEVVIPGTDLDEALKEQLWFASFPAPNLLEDLVGFEEVLLVEQANSLLDWVQTGTVRDGRHPARPPGSDEMKLCGYGFVTSNRQTPPCSVTVNAYPFRSARIGIDEVAVASLSVRISTVVPCGNDSSASFAWMKGYGHNKPRVSTPPLRGRLASVVVDVASMASRRCRSRGRGPPR